mgnify:CR=1 FL=1
MDIYIYIYIYWYSQSHYAFGYLCKSQSTKLEFCFFQNLHNQAIQTMYAAHNRTESRGAHARDDYPDRDDANWMKHTITYFDDSTGKVNVGLRDVVMTPLDDEMPQIPPKKRVY